MGAAGIEGVGREMDEVFDAFGTVGGGVRDGAVPDSFGGVVGGSQSSEMMAVNDEEFGGG